jgi:hypothetical protein
MDEKHKLNIDGFKRSLEAKGWFFNSTFGWTAPIGHEKTKDEQDWVDAVEENIECPLKVEQKQQ